MTWRGVDDFRERLTTRLNPLELNDPEPDEGDVDMLTAYEDPRAAAVLIGLVEREQHDLNVVLTLRPHTMSSHAGQVAFPGGKQDDDDPDLIYTALREAQEEVGVQPDTVQLRGRSGPYITGSGFRVMPVVGELPPDFDPVPDPMEVAKVFETPMSFLMNPENHERKQGVWNGKTRHYLAMPYEGNYIWGVTAGIIRALYDRLYLDQDEPWRRE